jgi:hypothetical protein
MDNEIKKLLKDNHLIIPSKNFTDQTMQKIHEMHEDHQAKRKISRWFVLSPLAAAAALALFLTFFLPWGSPGTISWADVQKQLEQIHTMTARFGGENTTYGYKKLYIKDSSFRRIELYEPNDDLSAFKPEPDWVFILKNEAGLTKGLTLHPDSRWAEMWTGNTHSYGPEPSLQIQENITTLQQFLKYTFGVWNQIQKITANETKPIGSQIINNKPAVGFSFELPAKELGLDIWEPLKIPGKIWASRHNGVPLLIELEFNLGTLRNIHIIVSDIQWNAPVDEKLFDLTPPVGWRVSNHLDDSIEYTNINLRLGVTLNIGPEWQKPLATAGDVTGLVRTERSTDPNVDPSCTGLITIELIPAAAKRLHNYANAHPDKPIIVNFNGEIKAAAKLDAAHPAQVSFDITPLSISMFNMEEKFTTAAIEKNKP